MGNIEQELHAIKERNARVEADKAWETSFFRKLLLSVMTYVVASLALYAIGVSEFYFSAAIPAIGYMISTLSLPVVKEWWIKISLDK